MRNINLIEETDEKVIYVLDRLQKAFKEAGQVDCGRFEFRNLTKYDKRGLSLSVLSETLTYSDYNDKLGVRRELWVGLSVWFKEEDGDRYETAKYIKEEILSKFDMPAFYDEDGTLGNFRYIKKGDWYSLTFYVNPFYEDRKWQNHVL